VLHIIERFVICLTYHVIIVEWLSDYPLIFSFILKIFVSVSVR